MFVIEASSNLVKSPIFKDSTDCTKYTSIEVSSLVNSFSVFLQLLDRRAWLGPFLFTRFLNRYFFMRLGHHLR